jgi:hypothetical protein
MIRHSREQSEGPSLYDEKTTSRFVRHSARPLGRVSKRLHHTDQGAGLLARIRQHSGSTAYPFLPVAPKEGKRNTETYVVDEIIVERFLRRPQSAGSTRGGAAALCRFLRMLRDQGATRRPKKPPLSPQQRLTTSSGLKIGKAWRFRPSTIDEWLREQERRTAVE